MSPDVIEKVIFQMRLKLKMTWSRPLGDGAVRAIAGALAANSSLTQLMLFNAAINADGAAALAAALRVNSTLRICKLFRNDIGAAGAAALAGALVVNTTLTELDLCENGIGTVGAAAIAKALGVNTTLIRLDLRLNRITAAGSAAVAAAIAANRATLVPVTPAQRIAFLTGHLRQRTRQRSPLARLPFDMVRRILTRYWIKQGRREWDTFIMRSCPVIRGTAGKCLPLMK
jgi:hypothetical protein